MKRTNLKFIARSSYFYLLAFVLLGVIFKPANALANVQSQDVLIVDTDVPQKEVIFDALLNKQSTLVINLNNQTLPEEQIAKVLSSSGFESVRNIYVFSHGQSGEISLGASQINAENLRFKNGLIQTLNRIATESSTIAFYACNAAMGSKGEQLYQHLANVLDAKVAMSNNPSGVSGDWMLEKSENQKFTQAFDISYLEQNYRANLQSISDPYCISEFATLSDKVTEMTVDWNNNILYFTGEHIYGRLYKAGMNGQVIRISNDFANSAAPGLLFNYISTDIVYYNDSIFTNSEGNLIVVDLSPTVTSSSPYAFPGDNGAEAGMAVVGDKIYTTDGKGSANAIYEYDIASNTSSVVVSGLPSDTLHGLEYCAATDKLYMAISPLGIYEVDVNAGTYTLVTDPLPENSRSNFAVDPTGAYAFVHTGSSVYRYNLSTGVGEVFVSGLLASNFCDLKFGPSSTDPAGYSLYIGGNDRIYEVTGFVPGLSADTPILTATQPVICPLGTKTTTISVADTDQLNGASAWYLYSGSCGGTFIESNTAGVFDVTPSTTTTYYVRGEGECNVAPGDCGSITIVYGDIQPPVTSLTHVSCNGEANGEIEVFASGGTAPYEYSIDNGATFQSTNLFTGLAAGQYQVVVQESNGCINNTSVTLTEPDPLSFTYSVIDISCNGGTDGVIEITASGGLGAGYEYSVDGGTSWQTSNTFRNLLAGTYQVMIRDRVYNYPINEKRTMATTTCETAPVEVVLTEPTEITFTSSQTEVSCNGGNDGTITFVASGGTGGAGSGTYQYSVDGGATWTDEATVGGLTAGDYSLAVRDKESALCAVYGETRTITEPTAILFSATQTNISCNGGNEGEITVTASGGEGGAGTATYDYSIDGGVNWQTSNVFSNLVAGDYYVVVRDQGQTSCQTDALTVTITEPTPLSFTVEQQNISCNGSSDGQIVVLASGGVGGEGSGTYQYSINGGLNWQDNDTFDNLLAGTYQVVIRDKVVQSCTSELQAIVITESDPLTFSYTQRDVSCYGGNDGQFVFTASGGSGAGYLYSIDGGVNFQESNIFNGLVPNRYILLIADQSNTDCISDVERTTITQPTPITFTVEKVDVSCFECDNGVISVSASGGEGGAGTGLYQYSIDGGANWQDGAVFTGLAAGTYQVMVRDRINSSCAVGPEEVIITQPTPLVFTTTHTNIECAGNASGEIQITANGGIGGAGSGTYQYSIDDGASWSDNNVFSNLTAGTYPVRVRDKVNTANVTEAELVEITEPTPLSFTFSKTEVSCNGNNDGSVVFTASGGVGGEGSGTYSYSVDGGANWQESATFSSLHAGQYELLIRDAVVVSCTTDTELTEITEPTPLDLSVTKIDANCSTNDDGEIHLTVSGGTGGAASGIFEYTIDGGANWQDNGDFTALSSADYIVAARDKENPSCSTVYQTVFVDLISPINLSYTFSELTCNGSNDGVIDISGQGGTIYEFTIDGGTSWQDSGLFENLNAGDYNLITREKDNPLCSSDTEALSLGEPTEISFTTEVTNATCTVSNDGEIAVTATGGQGGAGSGTYDYSKDGGVSWQDSNVFTGLIQGDYEVIVRDKVNIDCWSNTEMVSVFEYSAVEVLATATHTSCYGGNDGSISITATGGSDYEYSIDNGASFATSNVFNGLTAGTYTVVVREQALPDCFTEPITVIVEEPSEISFGVLSKEISCNGGNDGYIVVNATGGDGGAGTGTYEYSNDGGLSWQTDNRFLDLIAGTYSVVVRDLGATACQTDPYEVILGEPSPLGFTVAQTNLSCFGSANGQLEITVTGGVGGDASGVFEYSIDNGTSWQESNVFASLDVGTYQVVVRDQKYNSCQSNVQEVILTEPTELEFTYIYTDADCSTNNDGEIVITATGGDGGDGSGTYQYSIDGGATWQDSNTFSGLSANIYTTVVRDKVNTDCWSASTDIKIRALSPISFTQNSLDVSCPGSADGEITVNVSGGASYDYSIDNGLSWQASNVFANLSGGTYNVVVRDQATPGCESETSSVDLFEADPLLFTYTARNESCNANGDGEISFSAEGGESGTFQYSIDGGAKWADDSVFSSLKAGNYSLIIRDKAKPSCTSDVTDIALIKASEIGFTTNVSMVSCNGYDDGEMQFAITEGNQAATYEYTIDNGASWQLSNVFSLLEASYYFVGVREQGTSACQSTIRGQLISEPDRITLEITKKDESCDAINNGEISVSASGATSESYEYTIDGGTTFQDSGSFLNLGVGTYSVFARDKTNPDCTSDVETVVIEKRSQLNFTVSKTNVSCNGAVDGTITVGLSIGSNLEDYEFSIDEGISWQASNVFEDLPSGDYAVLVRKIISASCLSYPEYVQITEPNPIDFTATVLNESCGGTDDGMIKVKANGGSTLVYEYSKDNGLSWQTESTFENLSIGTYQIVVRDRMYPECQSAMSEASVGKDSELNFTTSVVNVHCYGGSDGKITVKMDASAPAVDYEYSIDAGANWQSANVFTDLSAATYYVIARRVGGTPCQTAHEVVLTQPELINFTVDKLDLSCANEDGGQITINAVGGFSGLYQYSVDDGANWQDENIFAALAKGSYLVLVRDKNYIDCQANPQSVELTAPNPITISVSTYDLWCHGSADGEIIVNGSGVLTYSIDGGQTYVDNNGSFTGLDAGTYQVVVKDANGCEQFYENNPVVLTEPQGVLFQDVAITYGNCDGGLGSIDIDARSSLGSVLYSIDNGATYQSDSYFGNLSSGTYYVVVKETDGCENAYPGNPINLTLASELSVTIDVSPEDNLCTYYPITLTANGPDIQQYTWNTGEHTQSIELNTDSPESYYFTVDVVSDHGCTASADITLDVQAGSPIEITATPRDTTCKENTIRLTAVADNAVSYLWKPDNVASDVLDVYKEDPGAFTYYVEVTNMGGCTSLDSIQLVFEDCIGLNELDVDGVQIDIFPNPSENGQFMVEINGVKEEVEVWIIDFDGRIVLQDKMPYSQTPKLQKQYNLQGFERGVYFIRLATRDKVSYKRIILF